MNTYKVGDKVVCLTNRLAPQLGASAIGEVADYPAPEGQVAVSFSDDRMFLLNLDEVRPATVVEVEDEFEVVLESVSAEIAARQQQYCKYLRFDYVDDKGQFIEPRNGIFIPCDANGEIEEQYAGDILEQCLNGEVAIMGGPRKKVGKPYIADKPPFNPEDPDDQYWTDDARSALHFDAASFGNSQMLYDMAKGAGLPAQDRLHFLGGAIGERNQTRRLRERLVEILKQGR